MRSMRYRASKANPRRPRHEKNRCFPRPGLPPRLRCGLRGGGHAPPGAVGSICSSRDSYLRLLDMRQGHFWHQPCHLPPYLPTQEDIYAVTTPF